MSKFGTLKIFVSHFGVVSLSTTRLPVPTMPDTQSSGKKRTLDAAFDDIIGSSDSDDPLAGTGTGGPQATQRSRSQAQAPPKKKRGPGKKNSEPIIFFKWRYHCSDISQRSLSMKRDLRSLCRTRSRYILLLR